MYDLFRFESCSKEGIEVKILILRKKSLPVQDKPTAPVSVKSDIAL